MKRYLYHQMIASPIILAIAPGTRELGIAVFIEFELIYFSVKTSNPKNNLLKQVSKKLRSVIKRFKPQIVVIKSVSQYQKLSKELENVINQIKTEAERNNLRTIEITFEQIKNELGNNSKTTQKKVFESLLSEYPELKRFWNRPNKWQNNYYAFLFSAVAVGAAFLKSNSGK